MRLYTPGAWGPGPHGVPSLSGRLVWVWLNRASRWAPSPARPEPPGYLGGVPTPAGQSGDPGLALIDEAVIEELFKLDSGVRLQIPAEPTPETAAVRLACLALRQAGRWGPPAPDVDVAHPRFTEAVEAAAAHDDEQQALDAATAILEGPEALEAFGFTP